jgi:hypothetical protein
MEYVGIDWAYRRASWCALGEGGAVVGEGVVRRTTTVSRGSGAVA